MSRRQERPMDVTTKALLLIMAFGIMATSMSAPQPWRAAAGVSTEHEMEWPTFERTAHLTIDATSLVLGDEGEPLYDVEVFAAASSETGNGAILQLELRDENGVSLDESQREMWFSDSDENYFADALSRSSLFCTAGNRCEYEFTIVLEFVGDYLPGDVSLSTIVRLTAQGTERFDGPDIPPAPEGITLTVEYDGETNTVTTTPSAEE